MIIAVLFMHYRRGDFVDKKIIYLDYAATTPIADEVMTEMMIGMQKLWGNASSEHILGRLASEKINAAIHDIANFLEVPYDTIRLTSGATESINLALKGVMGTQKHKKHLIAITTEHKATLQTVNALEREGFEVTFLAPNDQGKITKEMLEHAIRPDTAIFTSLWVNNETGEIYDIEGFREVTLKHNIIFHVDATQALPHFRIDLKRVDLASFTAHKIYGPKGIGVLYKREFPKLPLKNVIDGAKSPLGNGIGTLSNHQILGLSRAMSLLEMHYKTESDLTQQRCHFLLESLKPLGVTRNGHEDKKVDSIINLHIPEVFADNLMNALPHLCFSRGSACNSDETIPSHVLTEQHYSTKHASESIRISLGRQLLEFDFRKAVTDLYNAIDALQKIAKGIKTDFPIPLYNSTDKTFIPDFIEPNEFIPTHTFKFTKANCEITLKLEIQNEMITQLNICVSSSPFILWLMHLMTKALRKKGIDTLKTLTFDSSFISENIPEAELRTVLMIEQFLRSLDFTDGSYTQG